MARGSNRERVITSQYQQRAGTRENTTVIVTVGADGTSIPPMLSSRALHTKSVGVMTILSMLREFSPKNVKTEANFLQVSDIRRKVGRVAKLVLNGSRTSISTQRIR
jgi:hypothetical protein